jgi:hypothetical protein
MAAKKLGQYIQDIDKTILERPNKKEDNSLQVRYDLPVDFNNRHFIEIITKLYQGAGWDVQWSTPINQYDGKENKIFNYLIFTPA